MSTMILLVLSSAIKELKTNFVFFSVLGLDEADTIVTLPVGTTSAEFKKLSETYNLIGVVFIIYLIL